MNDKKPVVNSFKSYIGFDNESLNTSNEDSFAEQLTPRLLPKEMLIAEAQNVLMFTQLSERKQGKSGVLCVTNFKLSFITTEDRSKEESTCYDKLNLGEHDVCLSNVDTLYLLGDKKRKLVPGKNFTEKVKGLYVVCKNMKVLTFSFKFSPIGHGKTLTNALLHHAFPMRHHLLFAYDYKVQSFRHKSETLMFRDAGDWGKELARTECKGWRLSAANHDFQMSASLPQWIVVPSGVLDWQLNEAARHFRCGRPPLWCWCSKRGGAALVRMADIMPTITDRAQENIMLECVRKSHPRLSQPIVMDLTKDLPSPKDVHISFVKLRDICTPEDIKQFWIQDLHFYSLLESSRWLHCVSSCLAKSLEAAKILYRDVTVVLQELDGRDMCCVVSSLTQLLLEPHYRTLHGFQSLVQKEWVVMGHPFCTRLGHVYSDQPQQSPVFLLFLDCVWQLLQQFPTEFQFTETYLTALWETAHISTFDTFLFDCERDRFLAESDPNNPLVLRSVWEEELGFRDTSLFYNPFYSRGKSSGPCQAPPAGYTHKPLLVKPGISSLELWHQCYFRHIPLLEIIGGGYPQVDLQARMMVTQLEASQELGYGGGVGGVSLLELDSGLEALPQIGCFFPFSPSVHTTAASSLSTSLLVSSLSLNHSFHSTEAMLDSQSILSSPD